jgi:predicted metal-dependent hydrolase
MPDGAGSATKIRRFYEEAFETFDRRRKTPEIDVQFYPYVGINHTIRVRDGRVFVRIADICRDMPAIAQKGLAYILVAKLLRKRVPDRAREVYSEIIESEVIQRRANANKKKYGRKVVTTHAGEVYDLRKVFDRLNREYFWGTLRKPTLTWSSRKTYRVLGHYDATHDTIVISKSLDSSDVPQYVLESVLFHEMLHIYHPTVHHNGRRYNHTPAFRRDEEAFEHFEAAERWIERSVPKLKRNAKKKN